MSNPLDPKEDYSIPKSPSMYMKFEESEDGTEFMPLASAITGYEYWNVDNKPVRSAEAFDEIPEDIKKKDGKPEPIKHFWAFPVWDFADKKVKVLQITQKTIMTAIRDYTRNAKWGSPIMKYSFTVKRDDSSDITRYTTMANPSDPTIDYAITEAWEQAVQNGFDITRLYEGGDPFTAEKK